MQLMLFISGKAFSGKDTFYKAMHSLFLDVIQSSFALEVKKEFCRLNPDISLRQLLEDPIIKAKYRKELIEIGDGYRIKYGDDTWTNKHHEGLQESGFFETNYINCVTDTRYRNENHDYPIMLMKNNPSVVCLRIRIHASLETRLLRMGHQGAITYIRSGLFSRSECDLDDGKFDFEFDNNYNYPLASTAISRMMEDIRRQMGGVISGLFKFKARENND